jgi:hypothetical protein
MDPIIFLNLSRTDAQAVMQLAGERIQTLSYRLTQDHTTTSRSDLLRQINLLTNIIVEVNSAIRQSDETKTF